MPSNGASVNIIHHDLELHFKVIHVLLYFVIKKLVQASDILGRISSTRMTKLWSCPCFKTRLSVYVGLEAKKSTTCTSRTCTADSINVSLLYFDSSHADSPNAVSPSLNKTIARKITLQTNYDLSTAGIGNSFARYSALQLKLIRQRAICCSQETLHERILSYALSVPRIVGRTQFKIQ